MEINKIPNTIRGKTTIRILFLITAVLFFSLNLVIATTTPSSMVVPEDQILTPSGYKSIIELKKGDEVVGIDHVTGNTITNIIEEIEIKKPEHYYYWELNEQGEAINEIRPEFTYYTINGQYELFKDQSIFANNRLVHASEIAVGDTIYGHPGQTPIIVNTIQSDTSHGDWVRLSVSGNHTYVMGGLLLHNASRYWVGGGSTANWNATGNTNWGSVSNTRDNASVPGSSDAVIFDGIGNGASNSTLSASITINTLDMTGYANVLTHNTGVTLTINGDTFKLASGMTYTKGSNTASAVSLTSTTGTSGTPTAITTAGKSLGNLTLTGGATGYFRLQDNLDSTGTLTLTSGTFDAGNRDLSIVAFSSSNSNTRGLMMGTGIWNLTGTGTVWTTSTVTGMTMDAGTSTIRITEGSSTGKTFTSGVLTFNDIVFGGSGSGVLTFGGGGSYRDVYVNNTGAAQVSFSTNTKAQIRHLNFTGFNGEWTGTISISNLIGDLTLSPTMTNTYTGTISITGTTSVQMITSNGIVFAGNVTMNGSGGTFRLGDDFSMASTTTLTLTAGTFDLNNRNISIGKFSSSNSNIRGIIAGSGTWTLTSNNGTLWTTSTVTNLTITGRPNLVANYSGSLGTRTFTPGGLSESSVPNLSITAGTDIVSLSTSINNLDFTGFSGTVSNLTRIIYGNLVISSTMTATEGGNITTFAGSSGVKTITSNGNSLNSPITISASGATIRLVDDFTLPIARAINLSSGTFDANNKNVTIGRFSSTGSSVRSLIMGAGQWTLTGDNATLWNTDGATGDLFTLVRGNQPIILNFIGSSGTRQISGASTDDCAVDFNITAGSDTVRINASVRNVNFTGFSGLYDIAWTSRLAITGDITFSNTMTFTPNNYGIQWGSSLLGTSIAKWWGAVLGSDGKIYGIPRNSSTILIIDPMTETASLSYMGGGPLSGGNKWSGGALALNGKIYTAPFSTSSIMIMDTIAGTSSISTMGADLSGSQKWVGGVRANNGKIYFIPYDATDILIVDPVTETATRSAMSADLSGSAKWDGGVLGPDGKIYGIPYNAEDIIIIDPDTNIAIRSNLGADLSATGKWADGVVASDNKIYAFGFHGGVGDGALVIDPFAGKAEIVTNHGATNSMGTVLGNDGKIYNIPFYDNTISALTPLGSQSTVERWDIQPRLPNTADKWVGGVSASNGKIYAIPASASDILIIDPARHMVIRSAMGAVASTPGTRTFTTNGNPQITLESIIMRGDGATFELSDDLSLGRGNIILGNGIFNTKNHNIFAEAIHFVGNDSKTANFGSSRITLYGSSEPAWNSYGASNSTLNTDTSSVILTGAAQSILGSNSFHHLTKISTSSDTLSFQAGTTQTVRGTLRLEGDQTNRLMLRSLTSGREWYVNPMVAPALSNLDVKDSNNTNSTPINAEGTNSIDSGNNTNWKFSSLQSVSSSGGGLSNTGLSIGSTGSQPVYKPELFNQYKPLSQGMEESDVKKLQQFLNHDEDTKLADEGPGSPGQETEYFGPKTKDAVVRFQEKYKDDVLSPWDLIKGTGYVGWTTLVKINQIITWLFSGLKWVGGLCCNI